MVHGFADAGQKSPCHIPIGEPIPFEIGILARSQLVRGHQLHGFTAQNANAVQASAVCQHLNKAGVVIQRGIQTAGADLKLFCRDAEKPIPRFRLQVIRLHPGGVKMVIYRGRTGALLRGEQIPSVHHPKRPGDFLTNEVGQRFPADHADHRPQDV